jgi:hypothetical protein
MARHDYLFSEFDWFSVQEHQKAQLKAEVDGFDSNRLLNTSVDDLCGYLADKYDVSVPDLLEDSIVADQREAQVDVSGRFEYFTDGPGPHYVPGTTVEITIPYSGDSDALRIRPTTYTLNPPRARIQNNTIVLEITGVNLLADEVRKRIDSEISSIKGYLANLRSNAATLHRELPNVARAAVDNRRAKLLENQNLVASLGLSLKVNPRSPESYTAPNVRRKLAPTPPPASTAPYRPEPSLANKDYDHILEVIQNMAHVMERSPAAFATMDEEALRTHFLVQLNGHYEGQATGETFNFEGKTDILIRSEGKNIFVGECKFWGGPKKLLDTINQLLGYSAWRDTKVAILLFNRNKSLSKVLEAVQETVSNHPNCKKAVGAISETSFRYVFAHRDDANREMTLTVLVFDVPA